MDGTNQPFSIPQQQLPDPSIYQMHPPHQQQQQQSPFQPQMQQISEQFVNRESPGYQKRIQKREQIKQNMQRTKQQSYKQESCNQPIPPQLNSFPGRGGPSPALQPQPISLPQQRPMQVSLKKKKIEKKFSQQEQQESSEDETSPLDDPSLQRQMSAEREYTCEESSADYGAAAMVEKIARRKREILQQREPQGIPTTYPQQPNFISIPSPLHQELMFIPLPIPEVDIELGRKLLERAKDGEPQQLISLLKDGAFPNASDEISGDSALHIAMKRENPLIFLKAFFDESYKHEVDINAKNRSGDAIFHIACRLADPTLSNYLLSKGADPNLQDGEGNTSLHLLATRTAPGSTQEVLQQCLDYGANIEISNYANLNCNQLTNNTVYQRMFVEQKLNFNEDVTGGDIEVALCWNGLNDLDLNCNCPCGSNIYYGRKQCPNCNGFLDFDMNVQPSNTDPRQTSKTPVEHLYWPKVIPGNYRVNVVFFRHHEGYAEVLTDFLIIMKVKEDIVYEKTFSMEKQKQSLCVLEFSFDQKETLTLKPLTPY